MEEILLMNSFARSIEGFVLFDYITSSLNNPTVFLASDTVYNKQLFENVSVDLKFKKQLREVYSAGSQKVLQATGSLFKKIHQDHYMDMNYSVYFTTNQISAAKAVEFGIRSVILYQGLVP